MGSETILLVDDEEDLRRVAQRSLEGAGYKVLAAGDGGEALRVADAYEGEIHLLLTDVAMPGMGGKRVGQALTAKRPKMKILFMSGYTDDAIVHHGTLDPGVALLEKPFTGQSLTRKVREVLDGGGDLQGTGEHAESEDLRQARSSDEPAWRNVPVDVVNRLCAAVHAARYEEIMKIVELLQPAVPAAAESVRRLAEAFDYGEILALVGRSRKEDAHER